QDQLHLARVDVEAAGDDELLDPAADREGAVLPDLADVAGAEETVVGESLPGRLRVAPVAPEDLAAFEQDLVELTELHLDAWKRKTDAARLARAVVGIGYHDAALGDAVSLDRWLAQQSGAALEKRRRQRRRSAHEHANVRKVGRIFVEPVAQALVHRGHAEEHGSAPFQLGDHTGGSERNQGRAASAQQRPVQAHAKAVEVEERERVDQDVTRRPAPNLDRAATLREEVAVVEQRALR